MTEPRKIYQHIPRGLLVGLGLGIIVQWIGTVVAQSDPWRGSLLSIAGLTAATWLAAAGARELARGLPQRQARGAHLASFGFAAVSLWRAWVIVLHFHGTADENLLRIGSAAAIVTSLGAVWAAGGMRRPVLAIATVFVGALIVPVSPVAAMVREVVPCESVLGVFDLVSNFVWTGLLLIAFTRAAADSAAAPEQRADATRALRFAGQILWIRVAMATLGGMFIGFRIIPLINFSFVGSTALGAITLLLFAMALVKVAAASGTGLARTRLHVGAFFALTAAVIQAVQAAQLYLEVYGDHTTPSSHHLALTLATQFSVIAPLAAAVGIVLLVSAIGALARAVGDEAMQRAARQAAILYGVLTIGSVLLRSRSEDASTMTGVILFAAFSSTIAVGAQVIVAALCGKAAVALADAPVVPTATVRAG